METRRWMPCSSGAGWLMLHRWALLLAHLKPGDDKVTCYKYGNEQLAQWVSSLWVPKGSPALEFQWSGTWLPSHLLSIQQEEKTLVLGESKIYSWALALLPYLSNSPSDKHLSCYENKVGEKACAKAQWFFFFSFPLGGSRGSAACCGLGFIILCSWQLWWWWRRCQAMIRSLRATGLGNSWYICAVMVFLEICGKHHYVSEMLRSPAATV